MRKCYGRNPATGKRVGERHCWWDRDIASGDKRCKPRDASERYRCLYCLRSKEELADDPPTPTLKEALKGN